MKILVDMNLAPAWTALLQAEGWEAVHWSEQGEPGASDLRIMKWAAEHGFIVFTHDLDFGAMLAATGAVGPSVIQVRAQDVFPDRLGPLVMHVLRQHQEQLENGALLVVDANRSRLRILPLK